MVEGVGGTRAPEDWHPLADPSMDLRTGPNATPCANCAADPVVIKMARVDLMSLVERPFSGTGGPLDLETVVVPGNVRTSVLLGRPFGGPARAGAFVRCPRSTRAHSRSSCTGVGVGGGVPAFTTRPFPKAGRFLPTSALLASLGGANLLLALSLDGGLLLCGLYSRYCRLSKVALECVLMIAQTNCGSQGLPRVLEGGAHVHCLKEALVQHSGGKLDHLQERFHGGDHSSAHGFRKFVARGKLGKSHKPIEEKAHHGGLVRVFLGEAQTRPQRFGDPQTFGRTA